MNKENFKNKLEIILDKKDLKHQVKFLQELKDTIKKYTVWINDCIQEITKDYSQCDNCGEYSMKADYKKTYGVEKRFEQTYCDCGYGDDDEYGYVQYIVEYQECPLCGHKKESYNFGRKRVL